MRLIYNIICYKVTWMKMYYFLAQKHHKDIEEK